MRAYEKLPEGYREMFQINLQKDPKTAAKINAGAAAIMLVMMLGGNMYIPLTAMFEDLPLAGVLLRLGVLVLAYLAYIVLHELTHAVVMKAVGGKQVQFGFTGLYAYAGSRVDYFDKLSYRCIALAPLVVWGIVFGVLPLVLPPSWFWVVWMLQAGNIGGAAGDIYVTARLWKEPDTVRVRDTGVDMTVYDRSDYL